MGWVQQAETEFTATQGIVFTGADLGLSGFPGRIDFICSNITPLDPTIAGEASINLGVIASEPIGASVPDGTLSIWVIYEQEQSPPGIPVPPGDRYSYNGIGNTIPPDSGGFSPLGEAGWEDVELEVQLTGTAPYDPTGDTFQVICRTFEWEETPFSDYDMLPTESGDPGDPGYLAFPDPVTIVEALEDRSYLTLEWSFTADPATPDGFAIFDVSGPEFPTPVALVPDPDARSYAFPTQFTRDQVQQLAVTAYNATKKSQLGSDSIDNIIVELDPPPGIMPIGSVGNFYSLQFTGSNGLLRSGSDFTYAVSAGALPDGLSLDPDTGLVSGIPTLQGDYLFEIIASSVDVTDSFPTGSWSINIQLSTPLWSISPPSGDVESGETLVVLGPPAEEFIAVFDDKVVLLTPKVISETEVWLEVPYPPSGPCEAALDDCPNCQAAVIPCSEDITSEECQELMAACLACLVEEMEDIEAAEACNEAAPTKTPPPTVTIYVKGTQFSGSVPLGTFTIIESEGSGLYRFVMGKTNDTLYTAERDGTTYDVKIPNPGGKTGFFRS